MNCRDFEKALAALKVNEGITSYMKEHLDGCASCMSLIKKQNELFAIVENEKEFQVSAYTATRVIAALDAPRIEIFQFLIKPVRILAFAVAFVLGLGGAWLNSINSPLTNGDVILSDYFIESSTSLNFEQSWINFDSYEE